MSIVESFRKIGANIIGWFGPGEAIQPAAQESTEGRAFDYPTGYNLRIKPRSGEVVSFEILRAFADTYDLLRLVIETRKDQVQSYDWKIVSIDEKKEAPQEEIDAVTDFFRQPDREHTFKDWVRALLEDLFVLDAVAIYPRRTNGGDLYSLDLIAPETIKKLIDESGRTPMAPDPAYQQILKGYPANDLTTEQLYYAMRNYRTNRIYGMSPVEQIIMTVNIALRRQKSQLDLFTDGTVPDAFATVPETWTHDQLEKFQLWWDTVLSGDVSKAKRKLWFMPGGVELIRSGDVVLKNEFDEWLARIICFAFSISPTQLVKETNRATADRVAESSTEEGLMPLLEWTSEHINLVLRKYAGIKTVKFEWVAKEATAPLEQAQMDKIYADAKIRTVDEIRHDRGWPALTASQKEELTPPPPPMLPPGVEGAAPGSQQPPGAPGVKKQKVPPKKEPVDQDFLGIE